MCVCVCVCIVSYIYNCMQVWELSSRRSAVATAVSDLERVPPPGSSWCSGDRRDSLSKCLPREVDMTSLALVKVPA